MDRDIEDALKRILSRLQQETSSEETSSQNQEWTPEQREVEWLLRHGIPPRYARAMAEGVYHPAKGPVTAFTQDIVNNMQNGRGLIISGPVGTGKSMILGVVAQAAYRAWGEMPWDYPTALYLNTYQLYGRLIRPDDEGSPKTAREVPLLLLDELGSAYDTPYGISQLDDFFEQRHAKCRSTCVTTNMSAKQMRTDPRWSRIYDRLKQSCAGIELTGASRRGKQ